jgi:hypothetical protein
MFFVACYGWAKVIGHVGREGAAQKLLGELKA